MSNDESNDINVMTNAVTFTYSSKGTSHGKANAFLIAARNCYVR